jgi:hypothetical protein
MAAEANLSLLREHAAVILARQSAMRAVRRRIQKEGKIKEPLPLSTLSRLANEWLDAHPELLAEAAADPIVQNLGIVKRRRRVDRKRELLCESHAQNGGAQ